MQLKSSITIGNSQMATMIQKYSYLKIVPDSNYDEGRSLRNTHDSARSKQSGLEASLPPAPYGPITGVVRSTEMATSTEFSRVIESRPGLNFTTNSREPVRVFKETDSNRLSVLSINESAEPERRDAPQTGGSGSNRTPDQPKSTYKEQFVDNIMHKPVPQLMMPTQAESGSSDQHYEKILVQILTLAQQSRKDAALTYLRSLLANTDSSRATTHSLAQIDTEESVTERRELLSLRKKLDEQAKDLELARLDRENLQNNIESLNRRVVAMVSSIEQKTAEYSASMQAQAEEKEIAEKQLLERLHAAETTFASQKAEGDLQRRKLEDLLASKEEIVTELSTKNEFLQNQ